MGLVFDASSLIILNEIGLLPEVVRLSVALTTTGDVLAEVKSANVHDLVQRGDIRIVNARTEILPPETRLRLGSGETSAIAFAAENPTYWAVLDERLARDAASRLGIRFLGTARLIRHLADRGILTKDRARSLLESLSRIGFYIEDDTIRRVLEESPLEIE